ncbi:hypothetical protein ACGFJT_41155 [Actinomadura geliboluensis]
MGDREAGPLVRDRDRGPARLAAAHAVSMLLSFAAPSYGTLALLF